MSEKTERLYKRLQQCGFPPEFCAIITEQYLNTDYTAGKMLGFLSHFDNPKMEFVVDEMYAILADRENYVSKKINEHTQTKLNRWMRRQE